LSVTTCEQRLQAAGPSCCHHLQRGRISHTGTSFAVVGIISTIRSANRHRVPWKYAEGPQRHGAAKRKISVGVTGPESASSSSVTGFVFPSSATCGSSAAPPTTPITTLPSQSGWALGQSGSPFSVNWHTLPKTPSRSSQYYSSRGGNGCGFSVT
jgi:hypothetical protein